MKFIYRSQQILPRCVSVNNGTNPPKPGPPQPLAMQLCFPVLQPSRRIKDTLLKPFFPPLPRVGFCCFPSHPSARFGHQKGELKAVSLVLPRQGKGEKVEVFRFVSSGLWLKKPKTQQNQKQTHKQGTHTQTYVKISSGNGQGIERGRKKQREKERRKEI